MCVLLVCDLWPGLGNRKHKASLFHAKMFKINWLQQIEKRLCVPFGAVFSGFVWLVRHEKGAIAQQALQAAIRSASTQCQRSDEKMCSRAFLRWQLCVVV
jgi:hypothetical protein